MSAHTGFLVVTSAVVVDVAVVEVAVVVFSGPCVVAGVVVEVTADVVATGLLAIFLLKMGEVVVVVGGCVVLREDERQYPQLFLQLTRML